MKKKFFLTAASLLYVMGVFSQGSGTAGITEATTMITGYFDPAV